MSQFAQLPGGRLGLGPTARVVAPRPQQPRARRRTCRARGCLNGTSEQKPYCLEHVRRHAYVRQLLLELAAFDAEAALARRLGTRGVNPDGLLAQEFLRALRTHGSRTPQRLAVDVGVHVRVASACLAALCRDGLARRLRGADRVKRFCAVTDVSSVA